MKKSLIFSLFRAGIFIAAILVIYFKLFHGKDTSRILSPIRKLLEDPLEPLFLLVLFMTLLNWLIEARKWHHLVNKFERLSIWIAFKATIAGTCFSLFTPNRVGEFVGRVMFVSPNSRVKAVFATIVGSIAQFLVTIVMGSIGALWFIIAELELEQIRGLGMSLILSLSIILTVICLAIYFQPKLIRGTFNNIPFLRRWSRSILVLDRYDRLSLSTVLALSALRYLVFSTQFVLLLHLFHVEISWIGAYAAVFLVYLISTILPTIIFSELGVREVVALAVIGALAQNNLGIVAASFVLWVINLMLPAAVGAFIVMLSKPREVPKEAV